MARIKDSYLADLKARVQIYDVVAPHVKLKRAGKSWKGLSPFSQENTPSFFVHPERNMFKCFSTDTGGDAIRFVQLLENLTFMEAVETLAHRFNFPVQYEQGSTAEARQASSTRSELFRIHEEASSWFRERFLADDENGSFARNYWTEKRGFPLETAQEFEVGFAPATGGLGKLLREKKHSKDALKASGLFFPRGGERFRGRLIIPIRDSQGRIVAFTARQLEVTPQDDPAHEAKYVNSPETPIFRKGNLLFNLDKARLHVSDKKQFLLVEGQLDAMRCWQVGAKTAVGPQGTAFTEMQANLLARHQADGIEVLLDGDQAGRTAALRILPIALQAGLEATFLELPEGQDPDDLLAKGGLAALDELRDKAITSMPFAVNALLGSEVNSSPTRRQKVLENIFEIIFPCSSVSVQEAYLREASILLEVSEEAAKQDFRTFRSRRIKRKPLSIHEPKIAENGIQKLTTVEYELLFFALRYEKIAQKLSEVIDLEWVDGENTAGAMLTRILNEVQAGIWEKGQLDSLVTTDEERTVVSEIMAEEPRFPDSWRTANECLHALFSGFIRRRESELTTRLANHNSDNLAQAKELQSELGQLRAASNHPPTISPPTDLYGNDQDQFQSQADDQGSQGSKQVEKHDEENDRPKTGLVFGFE